MTGTRHATKVGLRKKKRVRVCWPGGSEKYLWSSSERSHPGVSKSYSMEHEGEGGGWRKRKR